MKYEFLKNLSECEEIKNQYDFWLDFMEEKVTFWLKNSEKHTKLHCARVMLYALLIGMQKKLPEDELEVLAQACAFHDSRRQDDWLDTGHGKRAAEYYENYCKENPEQIRYDKRTKLIMEYHDRDDSEGIKIFNARTNKLNDGILLYQIFKDADGLDRFRLAEDALDVKMLRTKEAVEMVEFAKRLVKDTTE
ncbi:MAG: hypothetical protein Q4B70_11900 [Lachnospiraceae bacterium]|nr:hypothetical protein [Lachnospiraceae bacterium]